MERVSDEEKEQGKRVGVDGEDSPDSGRSRSLSRAENGAAACAEILFKNRERGKVK